MHWMKKYYYIDCNYNIKQLKEKRILNYVKQNYKKCSLYDKEEVNALSFLLIWVIYSMIILLYLL